MQSSKLLFIALSIFLFGSITSVQAGIGDTIRVKTHNAVVMVTNPNTGNNPYKAWGVFPSDSISVRKIILHLDFKCPPGMACGEWDYIDWVYIRRLGSVGAVSRDMEIARFITPYGNSFTSTWRSEFHLDMTDYADLLRDSVEIEYNHTGYETNIGKGWLVTVEFEIIEGTPVMPIAKFTQLWKGSLPYGNAGNPIENYLQPDTVVTDSSTKTMRLRILQSGHGSDPAQCAEFCSKTRSVYNNGVLIGQRAIWRNNCGLNPVYPQAGTWIYSRGNWCPGAWVIPDFYEVPIVGGSTNILDVNMQTYTSTNPSANYAFNTQLIEYGQHANAIDASIEEIYSPNSIFEYSRMNPVCDNARINFKNNGSTPINSATIKYGIVGQPESTHNWVGTLVSNKSVDITLGDVIAPVAGNQIFKAYIATVNGVTDAYNYDDTATSTALIPPAYDSVFVFVFKTNNQPQQNSYTLKNHAGTTLYSRVTGSMIANTTYRDTFRLAPGGCYRFTFNDSGNDGLSWWANAAGGTGNARFAKLNNAAIKVFNPDFGSQIFQSFTVATAPNAVAEVGNEFNLDVFPNPTSGPLNLEVTLPTAEDVSVEIYSSMGQLVHSEQFQKIKHDFVELDLTKLSNGIYFAKVFTNKFSTTKEIVISR
jgi:hypothetical protein